MMRHALIGGIISLTVLVAACQQTVHQTTEKTGEQITGTVVGGIRYTGEAELVDAAPTRLQASVIMTNVTDRPLQLEYGVCPVLQGFDNPTLTGTPVWNSEERHDPVTGNPYVCPAIGIVREIGPGESLPPEEQQLSVPLYEILGHPLLGRFLPDGRYYWLARVKVNGQTIEVAAGEVALKMEEPPLPYQRKIDGLLYQMDTRTSTASPATIESTLTIINTTNEAAETSIAGNCPFSLYAYREEARRDGAYAAGEPDSPREGCLLEMVSLDLAPGESRQFSTTVTGARILGDSLPDGRYYLAAVVWLESTSMWLAAGEVQLER